MPVCPHCQKPITHLDTFGRAHVTQYRNYIATVDKDRTINYEFQDTADEDTDDESYDYEYSCPECRNKICNGEEEAIDFLAPTVLSLIKKTGLK